MSKCNLCDAGFPLDANGYHRPTQSLGMIPETRCKKLPQPETMPCGICGTPTRMLGTKRCDRCYELETHIHADPALARKILTRLDFRCCKVCEHWQRREPVTVKLRGSTIRVRIGWCPVFSKETTGSQGNECPSHVWKT